MTCPIDGCNAEFRRDSYITHLRKDHKEWMSSEMRKGLNLGALNDTLKGKARPFTIIRDDDEENYYICFGTKRVYTNAALAERACRETAKEHSARFLELFQETVSTTTCIDMIATKWAQYDKYAGEMKTATKSAELSAALARNAELEAMVDRLQAQLRTERIGELEAELVESRSIATRAANEAGRAKLELERTQRSLDGLVRELESVRQRHMEMSTESAELSLRAMEHSQAVKNKLEEYPKLKEKVKKYKKALEKSEKETQKRIMAMAMMMGGMGGAAASVGSRHSVTSGLDSDSDDE